MGLDEIKKFYLNSGGPPTVLDNLKVVCKSCNSKMGTQHMMTFKEHRYSSTSSQPEENGTKDIQ